MGSKKLLVTGAVIAVVGAAAILIPAIAAGVPLAGLNPASSVVAPGDGPGNHGRGNAFGHDRDSDDFPGNNGNAFGHDKDSDDFPGNRNGDDIDDESDDDGGGNGWGHHKDDPDFPGNNGRGQDD